MEQDIRWKQRFENFSNASEHLEDAIHVSKPSRFRKTEDYPAI